MNNVAEKLYNILGTKFNNTDIKTLDATGKETTDMEEIKMFSFDFLVNSKNYGPVVILISAEENLEVYYGDNTSKSLDSDAKKKWENLIEHLSTFARSNRLGFSLKNTSDLKYDLSNIADITESYRNIFEGYYGTRKTSYSPQGKAKIIIKHSKAIGEDDKRFRNISQLFIENADGERFKLPFKKLAGARAMARHVTAGGNPYDLFGLHISEMVKDINTLGGFVRRSKMYEGNDEAMTMVETGRTHYTSLRKGLKQVASVRGYNTFKENWEPSEITTMDEDTAVIRKLFMDNKVNARTEDALPLLAKLQKMAEARDANGTIGESSKAEIQNKINGLRNQYQEEMIAQNNQSSAVRSYANADRIKQQIDALDRQLLQTNEARGEMDPADQVGHEDADLPFDWDSVDPEQREMDAERDERHKASFNDGIDEDFSPDLREGDLGYDRPTEEEIYKKIKDWSLIALKGYARRIKMPREMIDQRNADKDTLIDEIMGYLFDDDWERKLMATGAFNETTGVTDYNPKSQGGTRKELLAKYAKSKDPKDATAARRAGATQIELQNAGNEMTEMKEFNEFKEWADTIVEGTWAFPDNEKALEELKEFMATEQPIGIDAINATDALYNILGDDDLFDRLSNMAENDPDADARPIVKNVIEDMYKNIDGYAVADQQNIKKLYDVIIADVNEGHPSDLDADNDSQLNASINKDLDAHMKNEGEEGRDPENDFDKDMISGYPGDDADQDAHYDFEKTKYPKHDLPDDDCTINESTDLTDLTDLLQRTNFLLKK